MKIFRRTVVLKTLPDRLVGFGKAVIQIFVIFKHPLTVLKHYILSTSPENRFVTTRKGMLIYFTDHRHDLISTVIVFCKREYGSVRPGDICVELGANTGMFGLYALSQDADHVYSFEANAGAYAVLTHNIKVNGFGDHISAFQFAVTDRSGDRVQFPVGPSPYNALLTSPDMHADEVETISLDDIAKRIKESTIDILQMDIEGAEYQVLLGAASSTLSRIREIRMEYHAGPLESLCDFLKSMGFIVVKHKPEQTTSGIIWFKNNHFTNRARPV